MNVLVVANNGDIESSIDFSLGYVLAAPTSQAALLSLLLQ